VGNIGGSVPDKNTHLEFYIDLNHVVFEYSGLFDTETEEWISSSAHFPRPEFMSCTELLRRIPEAEVAGTRGERLRLKRNPNGTMDIILTGSKDGTDISVLGVNLSLRDLPAGTTT
jgi:hypothetical protein